jgi:hypothetical protein
MIMPTSYMAHWQSIRQRRQAITDCDNLPWKYVPSSSHVFSGWQSLSVNTLMVNLPNPLVDPIDWLMWHANMSMVPSWLIWITLTKCSTFGDWFHILNPLKGVHDMCQWQFGSVVMKPSSIKMIISICAFHWNDHFDECTKYTKTVCLSLPMTISLLKWSFQCQNDHFNVKMIILVMK